MFFHVFAKDAMDLQVGALIAARIWFGAIYMCVE